MSYQPPSPEFPVASEDHSPTLSKWRAFMRGIGSVAGGGISAIPIYGETPRGLPSSWLSADERWAAAAEKVIAAEGLPIEAVLGADGTVLNMDGTRVFSDYPTQGGGPDAATNWEIEDKDWYAARTAMYNADQSIIQALPPEAFGLPETMEE